jgi:predicted GH43/DUF377 family glycosyl hydrolase
MRLNAVVGKPSLGRSALLIFVLATGASAEPFYLQEPAFPKSALILGDISASPEPSLRTSPENHWDSVDLLNPSVIYWRGQYWNYYSGFDGKTWRTGVAVSPDGSSWRKLDQNPVLSPAGGSWDSEYISANGAAIVFRDRVFYYYQGRNKGHVTEIGFATSADGVAFVRNTSPVLLPGPAGAWDETAVGDPYVIEHGRNLYLYFTGMNRAGVQRLGVAKSTDGITWAKHPGNPILDIGATGDFDSRGLGEPSLIQVGNSFVMLYTGRNDLEQRSLGIAQSLDGIDWRRQTPKGLPVPRAGWNSEVLCDPSMMLRNDGRAIRVWYGGGNVRSPAEHLNGQVGYLEVTLPEWAYSSFDPKSDWTRSPSPSTNVLKGSYPIEQDRTCWIGKSASIYLKPPFERGIQISGYVPVSIHRSVNAKLRSITVEVFINGTKAASVVTIDDKALDLIARVPPELRDRIVKLEIRASDVVNMAKAGKGEDQRDLGIIISRIRALD